MNMVRRGFDNSFESTKEDKVSDRISHVFHLEFSRYQQSIEKVRVVVFAVYVSSIGFCISVAQCFQSVDMVRVPVAQMFNSGMLSFDRSKNALLVIAVLKKADLRSFRIRSWTDQSTHVDFQVVSMSSIKTQESPARFFRLVFITLVKNTFQNSSRYGNVHLVFCPYSYETLF